VLRFSLSAYLRVTKTKTRRTTSDQEPRTRDKGPALGLPRPVWLLGWVSLATDAATEAIYPLLPFFLTTVLGAGAVSLGIIEGAAEATNSVLKILAGRGGSCSLATSFRPPCGR
jgi:hypothetical protein